jgi:hypothetical protein
MRQNVARNLAGYDVTWAYSLSTFDEETVECVPGDEANDLLVSFDKVALDHQTIVVTVGVLASKQTVGEVPRCHLTA